MGSVRSMAGYAVFTSLGLAVVGACSTAAVRHESTPAALAAGSSGGDATEPEDAAEPKGPTEVAPAECEPVSAKAATGGESARGNPEARKSAQRALSFLSEQVGSWQQQNQCYGCHVQAVSLEAYVTGHSHSYELPKTAIDTALRGMLELPGGAHTEGGLSHSNGRVPETATAFAGAAFAHYDEHVGDRLRDDLLDTAARLEEFQNESGWVSSGDWIGSAVDRGAIQTTTQAIQTWRQAYARTADERWLAPLRKAEGWMQGQAREIVQRESADVQRIDYAIMALVAAGASGAEDTLGALERRLRGLQNEDGSWPGSAMHTGQSLYALRMLGHGDEDPAIERGMVWLLEGQARDGGWGGGGASRAMAMWAVLGLVTLDVASVEVEGIAHGRHLDGTATLVARGRDNESEGVRRMEVYVDDVRVASGCGARIEHAIDAGDLDDGPHVLEVVATTAAGRQGRRRMELYTGDFYLTALGSRWEDGETTFSWRNVGSGESRVRLEIFEAREQDGEHARGELVHRAVVDAEQGAMRASWGGRGEDGEAPGRGRYLARVSYLGADGKARQTVELPFVHDTPEAQHAAFGEVTGQLSNDSGVAENTVVELVDGEGHVVQQTRSTRSGQYRFRNVESGRYKVRARRKGFDFAETEVQAAPAQASEADMHMH